MWWTSRTPSKLFVIACAQQLLALREQLSRDARLPFARWELSSRYIPPRPSSALNKRLLELVISNVVRTGRDFQNTSYVGSIHVDFGPYLVISWQNMIRQQVSQVPARFLSTTHYLARHIPALRLKDYHACRSFLKQFAPNICVSCDA